MYDGLLNCNGIIECNSMKKKALLLIPVLLLLAACQETTITIKDKFILDIVQDATGEFNYAYTFRETLKDYKSLIEPKYRIFVEYTYMGQTYQVTCDILETYWRKAKIGYTYTGSIQDQNYVCSDVAWHLKHSLYKSPEE